VVKAGAIDSVYKGGEHADTSRRMAEDLISGLHLKNVEILEGVFPDQTAEKIEHMRFRLCHIDVDVYQSAKDVVDWVWSKLQPGGIVVYDDYGFDRCGGITRYVEEQMACQGRYVIHNLNGHAIVVKR
jgi:O-methyltransferase